jgi:hypothetical protein
MAFDEVCRCNHTLHAATWIISLAIVTYLITLGCLFSVLKAMNPPLTMMGSQDILYHTRLTLLLEKYLEKNPRLMQALHLR